MAERDGLHESDVRQGITIEDSTIGNVNDDFFNVHSTLLIVQQCDSAPTPTCMVINPHVESGALDSTYGTNSVLESAVPGDSLSFFPFILDGAAHPAHFTPTTTAILRSAARVTDPTALAAAMRFANETHAQNPKGAMQFMGGGRAVDVWTIHLAPPLGGPVPLPRSLLSINALLSSGAVLRGNRFNITTCSARWKSPNSVIVNNTFAFSAPNLEITYLQPWFEGAAVIANITLVSVSWCKYLAFFMFLLTPQPVHLGKPSNCAV